MVEMERERGASVWDGTGVKAPLYPLPPALLRGSLRRSKWFRWREKGVQTYKDGTGVKALVYPPLPPLPPLPPYFKALKDQTFSTDFLIPLPTLILRVRAEFNTLFSQSFRRG